MRKKDLETSAEIIVCEVRPVERKKIAVIVFYRPPDSDLQYIKEFKRSLQLVQRCNRFDQVIICGDFNIPNIDWSTGTVSNNNSISNHFTKTVKDFYLCQMVYFPTRGENTLDPILTNIPSGGARGGGQVGANAPPKIIFCPPILPPPFLIISVETISRREPWV